MRGESLVLLDGSRVTIRPLQAEDRPAARALFERLSPHSLAQRFHSVGLRITEAILDMVTAGHVLVAELEGVIVALASYHALPGQCRAEVAIVVDDANQRRGIGLALSQRLFIEAKRAGVQRLCADVQSSNRGMLRLLRRLNLPITYAATHGAFEIEIELEAGAEHAPGPVADEMIQLAS